MRLPARRLERATVSIHFTIRLDAEAGNSPFIFGVGPASIARRIRARLPLRGKSDKLDSYPAADENQAPQRGFVLSSVSPHLSRSTPADSSIIRRSAAIFFCATDGSSRRSVTIRCACEDSRARRRTSWSRRRSGTGRRRRFRARMRSEFLTSNRRRTSPRPTRRMGSLGRLRKTNEAPSAAPDGIGPPTSAEGFFCHSASI